MLDNFTRSELDTTCKTLKERYGESAINAGGNGKRKFLIEVSGGVTPDNFEELAHPGGFERPLGDYSGRTTATAKLTRDFVYSCVIQTSILCRLRQFINLYHILISA